MSKDFDGISPQGYDYKMNPKAKHLFPLNESGGDYPDITISGSVDGDTSKLTVTKSGTDAEPSFDFAFTGLGADNGFVSLDPPEMSFYPPLDADLRVQMVYPVSVKHLDGTTESDTMWLSGTVHGFRYTVATPTTYGVSLSGMLDIGFENSDTEDIGVDYFNMFAVATFDNLVNGAPSEMVNLVWLMIPKQVKDIITVTGNPEIYIDHRMQKTVLFPPLGNNPSHDLSNGAFLNVELGVPDYRDISITRYTQVRVVVPPLPTPNSTSLYNEYVFFNIPFEYDDAFPVLGDDGVETMKFKGRIVLMPEMVEGTGFTGNYKVQKIELNYFNIVSVNVFYT